MALYESPKSEVAQAHLNLPDQRTMDFIANEIKVHKEKLLQRKKELELAKNWDLKKKELVKRFIKQDRRMEAEDDAPIGKKCKMSFEEMWEGLKLSVASHAAARREGKVIDEDRSMFKQDIDFYSGSLDDFNIFVKGSCTAQYTDDAYGSVADKITKTDKSSTGTSEKTGLVDDPAEFLKEPQDTVEKGKKSM